MSNQPIAWIEALKLKTMPELKRRFLYLEHMVFLLTELYNGKRITNVNIWIDSVDKDLNPDLCIGALEFVPETGWNSFNINFEGGEVPEPFKQFIHDFCTMLCAEKLVIESLITKE